MLPLTSERRAALAFAIWSRRACEAEALLCFLVVSSAELSVVGGANVALLLVGSGAGAGSPDKTNGGLGAGFFKRSDGGFDVGFLNAEAGAFGVGESSDVAFSSLGDFNAEAGALSLVADTGESMGEASADAGARNLVADFGVSRTPISLFDAGDDT